MPIYIPPMRRLNKRCVVQIIIWVSHEYAMKK
jgi:hypothetical protein